MIWLFIILLVIVLIIAASCIKIVPQSQAYILERLVSIRQHGEVVFILKCLLLKELQNV